MTYNTGFERSAIKIRGISTKSSDQEGFAITSTRTVLSSYLQQESVQNKQRLRGIRTVNSVHGPESS